MFSQFSTSISALHSNLYLTAHSTISFHVVAVTINEGHILAMMLNYD